MRAIPEFSDAELWTMRTTLSQRYDKDMDFEAAQSEVRLHPSDRELTVCPTLYWQVDGCHFVIAKTGERRYRCQFFYSVRERYSTGIDEFDDLAECAVTLLQMQADYHSKRMGNVSAQDS